MNAKLAAVETQPEVRTAEFTLVKFEDKKNSVRYNAVGDDPAMTSAYIMKHALPKPYPQTIKVKLTFD